jgi:hypothetical protein
MSKAYTKLSSAKILSAFLLVLSFGLAKPADAQNPVTGRLQVTGPRNHQVRKPFIHPRGANSLSRAKQQARIRGLASVPGLLSNSSTSNSSTLAPALEVTGFDGIDQDLAGVDPPDGAIAVSHTYVVQATNINLSVWTKTYDQTGRLSALTNTVSAADLDSLLGLNSNCHSSSNSLFGLVSDPSVDYDPAQDRFFVSMTSLDQSSLSSSLCVAVTETGDPSGNWFIYAFSMPASSLLDFPRAVTGSDGYIYIAGNFFVFDQAGNSTFVSARVYALKTTDLYAGVHTVPSMSVVGNDPQTGTPADSLTPARAVSGPGMYFISASNPDAPASGSTITLWKWNDPFGANVFTRQGSVAVATYTQPPPGIQLGGFPAGVTDCAQSGAVCIETNDARNLTAYWYGGTVWAAHHAGCTQGGALAACVQWYQLGNLDGATTLLQQGIVDDPTNPGRNRYFPAMAVDSTGSVVLSYGYSSASEYPGVAISTISSSGQVGPETVLKTGQATFASTRYGDYNSAALDPTDNLTIWQEQEYAKASDTWGTWISAIQIGGIPVPPSLSVTPTSLDFGRVTVGSTADKTIVVQNTGGGKLIGSASVAPPFSIVSGGSFTLSLGATQNVVVRFTPTSGVFAANVSLTSNAGDGSVAVTGTGAAVDAMAPNSIDLAAPPASFTVSGNGFADLGFGLPVVNFVRNGTVIAQARATAISGSTSLTVPFPTAATAILPNLPGLSAGTVQAQLYLQTSTANYILIGFVSLTVIDTTGVSAMTPNTIDLAAPPAGFTITGAGFVNSSGFGLPVVNFTRGSTVLAQARATGLTGSTSLTVPFPTAATALTPNLPGLSVGTVQAQVYLQTSATDYRLIGSVSLTVNNTTGVSAITPNTIDLASPPASFTITGAGFVNSGFGLPVVNFTSGSTILVQARATGLTGSTSLTVPFPTAATAIAPNLPGLSAGTVQAQVFLQTSATVYTLIGSVSLTVNDTRVTSGVSAITPNTIDLAAPPASFTITGGGFANNGFGLPVVNFSRGSTVLAQARATGLSGSTSLTVPFPTAATAIAPNLPGLSAGAVQVQVYLQTSATVYTLIGSVSLTVNDTRVVSGVSAITPNSIDLATPPASFTITGGGFVNNGFGLPVVNFSRGSTVLAQARATGLSGSTSLTVPLPTAATAIAPNLPGLSAGTVQVQVYVQTSATAYTLIGSVSLTVNDTRAVAGVSAITPNAIDLTAPPASFTITGGGFVNNGFGLPVVNFSRGSTVLAQARATGLSGSTSLTVPFPTAATAIAPNLPGLSAGAVQVQVYLQTSATGYTLIGSVSLTISDTP